jgi:hypothetical protein
MERSEQAKNEQASWKWASKMKRSEQDEKKRARWKEASKMKRTTRRKVQDEKYKTKSTRRKGQDEKDKVQDEKDKTKSTRRKVQDEKYKTKSTRRKVQDEKYKTKGASQKKKSEQDKKEQDTTYQQCAEQIAWPIQCKGVHALLWWHLMAILHSLPAFGKVEWWCEFGVRLTRVLDGSKIKIKISEYIYLLQ